MTKELRKRIITSAVLVFIVLNCLFINNYSWLFLLGIVALICWFEFINLSKKIWKNKLLIILATILSFSYLYLFSYSAYKTKIYDGEIIILFYLLVCIFSDVGGYVIGKSIGGKKLTKISPKKTISGSIGSFLFSLFPIGIYSALSSITNNNSFSRIFENQDNEVIFICLILSFMCQIGDLIISYFKRQAKVKDTGNVLPGHGGMLDRIDGIIFAVPTLFIIDYVI